MLKKKRHPLLLWLVLPLVLVQSGCDELDDENFPGWQPEVLVPLAYSSAGIREISLLENIIFTVDIPPVDVRNDLVGEVPLLPAFEVASVGPYEAEITDIFERIRAKKFSFFFEFNNAYPITIGSGTDVVFRNQESGVELLRETIDRNIPPGGFFGFEKDLEDISVDANIEFYLENFNSPGSETPVDFSGAQATIFTFELIFLELDTLVIKQGRNYNITNTIAWDIGDEPDEVEEIENREIDGTLTMYLDNSFALTFEGQIHFLDDNNNVIDSLFNEPFEGGTATIDQDGFVIEGVEYSFPVPLSIERYRNIQKAKRIRYRYRTSAASTTRDGSPLNGDLLFITGRDRLVFQFVLDAEFKVN